MCRCTVGGEKSLSTADFARIWIGVVHLDARRPPVPERQVASTPPAVCGERLPGIPSAVPHVAKRARDRYRGRLLRVAGGDRDLDHTEPGCHCIHEERGVEREPLRIPEERKREECTARIRAHPTVHIREAR